MYRVWIPLHVSGLWIPVRRGDELRTGSLGAGINLELGVSAKLLNNRSCGIYIGGVHVLEEHSSLVCSIVGDSAVSVESPVGLGKGFGVSAALLMCLSLLGALARGHRWTLEKSLWPAHIAEVRFSTGLGDVIAEYYGGLEVRVEPGAPGIGRVERIVLRRKPVIVAGVLPGGESTPDMLRRLGEDAYRVARRGWERLREEPSIEVFFEEASRFTRLIFPYEEVDELLRPVSRYVVGYYRKKQALIIWAEEDGAGDIVERLRSAGIEAYVTSISLEGLRIVYSREPSA